ncbi:alpha-protein kinase 2 isoform X1 [Heterocephalus glaber]|uniref:Alpha-protein kinase 2 n=1 Tax=Heterocephalus glaber TaxID=10181 RepID=A0AAX6REM1_HETGA|nr:alpha-protein kinase 2 isoform X1 [Heterocephalus glaber]XP_021094894.1 alpha-protein kinase 2 isoform X1 [Heterocephalus glaber]
MTDSEGPQSHRLCFLSTLLSQKVPEKSDVVLRCMISGQPKPEVTWYKNGQAIDECGIVSSYEPFENQYIHMLHLSCCTRSDAAVYQISARSCLGMICCSASIEVESPSDNPQLPPTLGDVRDTGWKHGTEAYEKESTSQTHEKEHPYKGEENMSSGTLSADSSQPKCNCLCSPQLLANNDLTASHSGNPPDEETRQTAEVYNPNNTEEIFLNSSTIPQNHQRTVPPPVSQLMDDSLNNDGPNDEVLASSHEYPKAQKYISFTLPLSEATAWVYPGERALVNKQPSEDSDSDYELCPEITLTYTEEFSDDDLEYLECSDVMTDYSNAVWQRSLQGTERVFLLESDDEEMEFSECILGGCEHFLSEMGCGPWVSGDTGPMEATTGFCGYHSQSQEVGVRSSRASRHSASSLFSGTLTLRPGQDGTATVTGQESCPFPTTSEAAENDCPGIQEETRDSHQAGEEFASDNFLAMDKAATELEMKPLSEGSERSGMKQSLETMVEERAEEKDSGSQRSTQKSTSVRRPRAKGKAKKLTLKDSAAESIRSPPPKGPIQAPLMWSNEEETPHATSGIPGRNSHFLEGESVTSSPAEQDTKTLQPSAGALPKKGDTGFQGEGLRVSNLLETSQAPDQSDHPQVQIQETVRERISLSQMPAFLEPTGEEPPFMGTTTNFLSNTGGIHKEDALLAQYLEVESCPQGPQQEEKQDRDSTTAAGSWADLEHELSTQKTNGGNVPLAVVSVHLPQDASTEPRELETFSVASPEPTDSALTLENVCSGSRDREAACVMECFEAGDQGTCNDTVDSPAGTPVDKYLPQDICSVDFELTEGQNKVCDLYSPDDKTLAVLFQTQCSEPPQSTGNNGKDRNSAVPPLFVSTLTWNMSQEATKSGRGESLAKAENSTAILSSTALADWARLSLQDSGSLGEIQPLSAENNSFVHFEQGDKSPRTCASVTTDTPASHSSVVNFPQEKPTALTALMDNAECLQKTRKIEDISADTVATKGHPATHHAVSISVNNLPSGAQENSPGAPDENNLNFPSNVQLSHVLSSPTPESTKQLLCLAPNVPTVCGSHVPLLLEGEGSCNNSPLQTDNQSRDKSQTMVRADEKSLEEDFQEKGNETKKGLQSERLSHQGSFLADDFQESLLPTSAAQGEANLVLLEHSLANCREERGHRSGLGTNVSVVAEATVEKDSQALSNVPSFSEILLEESEETGAENWKAGKKLKVLTLEASVSEIWPPTQIMELEYKEAEPSPILPDKAWALPDAVKADAALPEQGHSDMAVLVPSSQDETGPALAVHRETHEGNVPTCTTHRRSLSSQDLSQPRFLESSVDGVGANELWVTDSLSESSGTEWKENANSVSQDQGETQPQVDHLAFFKQILAFPGILESSVDPVDDTGGMEYPRAEKPETSDFTLGVIREGGQLTDRNLDQRVEVQPAILQVPCPPNIGGNIPNENRINQGDSKREEGEQSQHSEAEVEVQPAIWQAPCPNAGEQRIPSACNIGQMQEGSDRSSEKAGHSAENKAGSTFPNSSLADSLTIMTQVSVGVISHSSAGQSLDQSENDLVEPSNRQYAFSDSKERGTIENECGKHVPSSSDLMQLPCTSSPEGNTTHFPISHRIEELKREESQAGEPKLPSSSGSTSMTSAFISGKCESEKAPEFLQDPWQKGSILGSGKKPREKEKPSHVATQTGKLLGAQPTVPRSEEVRKKQEPSGSGHLAEGVKKKILSRVAALRLKLEEKENVRKNSSLLRKIPKLEKSLSRTDEKKDPKKAPCKREQKAPVLLKKIQAEMFPDHSGNVKLSCQFAEIHEDSTIWWTKDSKSIAQVQRSAGDNSAVSLAIVQASQKDQGLYYCCIKNSFGKVTAEFNLTAEVLEQLSSHLDIKGCEEIEFSQLIFREDFLNDSYFGGRLRGQIATEELHFGEGVHRKAFRSTVMQGLTPVFQPGHACVLKVHNTVAHGTRNNDELIQRNYKLAAQECYVQNTARHYAKIYAAEAQPLEGFGEVPEIIPIFLIHRPENTIPYATVEEELIGEFVKYSIRDGKEINFLRKESEAGQKCCTFQHWVYQKTSGCLLVTDMQGVGMKLTDVGIATLAKGYKGFKGNCSMTFIDQFKVLHQCNKYCKMLGLKSLQNNNQKAKKSSPGNSKVQTNSVTVKNPELGAPAEKKS